MTSTPVGSVQDAQKQFLDQYSKLQSYLGKIQSRCANSHEGVILAGLINRFRPIAKEYADLAVFVIEGAAAVYPRLPRRYHYGQVLDKIANHIGLLDDLVAHNQSAQRPWDEDLTALVWGIASTLKNPPILFNILSPQFQYVHFNYVNAVGIIGFPVHARAKLRMSLAVFWHEVAGYLVARARYNGELEQLAQCIQRTLDTPTPGRGSEWDVYRRLFMISKLERYSTRLAVSQDSVIVDDSSELRSYFFNPAVTGFAGNAATPTGGTSTPTNDVDSDLPWQMDWAGEFCEDLFGIMSLGLTYFRTLVDVLLQKYPSLAVGDSEHPPALLRLQVALDYLDKLLPANAAARAQVVTYLSGLLSANPNLLSSLQFGPVARSLGPGVLPLRNNSDARVLSARTDVARTEWFAQIKEIASRIVDCIMGAELLKASAEKLARSREPLMGNYGKLVESILAGFEEPEYKSDDSTKAMVEQIITGYQADIAAKLDSAAGFYSGFWPANRWSASDFEAVSAARPFPNWNDARDWLKRLHDVNFSETDGESYVGQTVVITIPPRTTP
jgi:hypothetical protein